MQGIASHTHLLQRRQGIEGRADQRLHRQPAQAPSVEQGTPGAAQRHLIGQVAEDPYATLAEPLQPLPGAGVEVLGAGGVPLYQVHAGIRRQAFEGRQHALRPPFPQYPGGPDLRLRRHGVEEVLSQEAATALFVPEYQQ